MPPMPQCVTVMIAAWPAMAPSTTAKFRPRPARTGMIKARAMKEFLARRLTMSSKKKGRDRPETARPARPMTRKTMVTRLLVRKRLAAPGPPLCSSLIPRLLSAPARRV